jgi:hypothetical protein
MGDEFAATTRRSARVPLLILRANAIYLTVAAAGGLRGDILGIFFGKGPVARVVDLAPFSGIGFVEAHGLALILGILLWRAAPARAWHLTAAAIHVLLGTANLVFWQIFLSADMLALGYVTTTLHWFFVVAEVAAAVIAPATKTASADALAARSARFVG